jgi:GDP-L-fucose synthase
MLKVLITGGNGNIASMIKRQLSELYNITSLSRRELDMLNFSQVKTYLENNNFDVVVHTSIYGGRRTNSETGDVTHNNLLMFENLLKFSDNFKMIINLDSAATYDRNTDILDRKECEISTVPKDYYGFSKYLSYNRSLQYNNVFNFRIFNIFHATEEPDRFISLCFNSKKTGVPIKIFKDRYFDFMYEDDFTKILKYYFENVSNQTVLHKTVNIGYKEKYLLSEVANKIVNDKSLIHIENEEKGNNYSGNTEKLYSYKIQFDELDKSIQLYENALISFLPKL